MDETKHLLSRIVSGDGIGCPIPSAHDKLGEAHYFIHELIANYHYPDEFRYCLSAFFQSARSVTFMIQKELDKLDGFSEWWAEKQERMKNDPNLKLLNDKRVETFHLNSLVPESKMFIGGFE